MDRDREGAMTRRFEWPDAHASTQDAKAPIFFFFERGHTSNGFPLAYPLCSIVRHTYIHATMKLGRCRGKCACG